MIDLMKFFRRNRPDMAAHLCKNCNTMPIMDTIGGMRQTYYVVRCANCPPLIGTKMCDTPIEAYDDWNSRNSVRQ